VVSSVHAFGESLLGTLFLIFLVICLVASVALIVWRRDILAPEHRLEALISREGAFLAGNVLLTIMMMTTLIGTIFPILSGVFAEEPVTVGQPFYNKVVAPMAVLLVGLMAIGPVLAFGKLAGRKIAHDLMIPAIVMVVFTGAVAFGLKIFNGWALLCTAIAVLGTSTVIVSFIRSTSARRRSTGEGMVLASVRLIDKDHRRYGGQLAHLGVMLLVVGVVGSSLFDSEQVMQMKTGDTIELDGQSLTFHGLSEVNDVNYFGAQATVTLTDRAGTVYTLRPQIRRYNGWTEQNNTEVAILTTWREDVYVTLAGWEAGGQIAAIRVTLNPLVGWIWLGGIVMSAGSLFSLLPRLLPQTVTARATVPSVATTSSEPAVAQTS
jgi:cytochrome c-type biogenesis protein CcmF